MAPFSNVAPSAGWSTVERRCLDDLERDVDDALDGRLGDLAGRRVRGGHLEGVLAAAKVDLETPIAGRIGVRPALLVGRGDRHRAARDGHALEDVGLGVLVDVDDRGGRLGHGDRRRLGEPQELHAEVAGESDDGDHEQAEDHEAGREGQALARGGDGSRDGDDRLWLARVATLAAPLEEDLVRVQAEVQRVVAQEALGVDRPRQLTVVAAFQGGQVAGPDLRVALGAVEVDALALAGREQALRQARGRVRRQAARRVRSFRPDRSPDLIPRRHRPNPCRSRSAS